jgi:hypothetical protein
MSFGIWIRNLTYKIPGSNGWYVEQSTNNSLYRLEYLFHLLSAQVIPSHDI